MEDLCRRHGISRDTYYAWKKKYGGMGVSEARRLKQLEEENARLQRIVADQALNDGAEGAAGKRIVTSSARRAVVTELQSAHGISERRALRWTGFPRASIRYRSRRPEQALLRERIRAHAADRPRWGYRRIQVLLHREGWRVNEKRVYRLYREEGLAVRRKGKRKRSAAPRLVREPITAANRRWCLDFVSDTLSNGRTFRCLAILDEYTRECLNVHVAHSIPSLGVIEALERTAC